MPNMDYIGTKCDSCERFIAFGQEHHIDKDGKISGLNYGHKVYKWNNSTYQLTNHPLRPTGQGLIYMLATT